MTAYFTLGHDVRHWTTFKVTGELTPEEKAALDNIESDEALTVAKRLHKEHRLTVEEVIGDDSPDYFAEDYDPNVLSFEELP